MGRIGVGTMRLSEERGKEILRRHGLAAPEGLPANSPEQAAGVARSLGGPVVVKAMIPVGGRGKAGLVRPAASPSEAARVASDILGRCHGGHVVTTVLVERRLDAAEEYYVSVVLDPWQEGPVLMFSPAGGVDIEETISLSPASVVRIPVRPADGWLTTPLSCPESLGSPVLRRRLGRFAEQLAVLYAREDLVLAEVNPLIRTTSGELVAADCKFELDDSALARHPGDGEESDSHLNLTEREVKALGGTLVTLGDGDIGIVCNGAGMGMAMLDMLTAAGLKPANFLDTGGGPSRARAHGICSVLLRNRNLRGAIINIWGGFTRLDEVARAIVDVVREQAPRYPVVVKLTGLHQEAAVDVLRTAGLPTVQAVQTESAVGMLAAALGGGT